jgi:hypothetical protein
MTMSRVIDMLDAELNSAKEASQLLRQRLEKVSNHLAMVDDSEMPGFSTNAICKAIDMIGEDLDNVDRVISKCFDKLNLDEESWDDTDLHQE